MAPLSDEEENYVRLALLLKGVTPRAVRTYFDREFPPTYLPSTLNTNYNTILDLKLKRVINQAQWNLLIPRNGIPDSKTFDVTLMICLIRNLTSINQPVNGFDSLPLPGETTPGSDLARIKYYRNKLAHHDSNTVDTAYFHTAWTDISNAVGRLGDQTMFQECQELKLKILDQSNQEIILEVKQSLEEMKELKLTTYNLRKKQSKVTENLRKLQSLHGTLKTSHSILKSSNSTLKNSVRFLRAEQVLIRKGFKNPIPPNIRAQFNKQIEDWKKKDNMFVSTRASANVMECLQDNSCVTLTAPSGAGKSFIARHTALTLQKAGYKIVPVIQPDDIRNYYQPGEQTVFVVDDICGNFIANQQQIDNWKQLLPVVDTIIADKCCKIIVSCRLQVYKDDKFNTLLPFKSCECNLISDKLCLTSKEKNSIASKYIGTGFVDLDKISENSDFFPLLCSLYDEEKHGDVNNFFENPYIVYERELDVLSRQGDDGKCKKCCLAFLVVFNNQLRDKWFKGRINNEQTKIIKDTCEACGINSIPKINLKTELDTLVGTFVSKQDGIYRTMHDKLFDILAYYFGKKIIDCLIKHGDSELVHERFIWQTSPDDENSNIDFIIEISDDHLELYLERFIKDWLAGKVAVVFSNNNMKVSSFRQQLIQYLQQLDRPQQITLANTKDTVKPMESCNFGTTPLVWNCYDGHTDMVQWMLSNDVVVDQCRDNGVSGLFMASQEGHTNIVKLLLERNSDVNICHKDGCSPLLQASQNGHTDIVKLLLERNPDVNLCNKDDRSPLLQASQNGHTDIVKLLLERNPNVNLCNKNRYNPLIKASMCGHTDIVRLLLERNPVPSDNTPLSTSYVNNNIIMRNSPSPVQPLMKHKPDINVQTYVGGNALYFSALYGNIEITQLLLENNADSNICIYSKQYIAEMIKNHPTGTLEKLEQNIFDTLVKSTSSRVTEYVSQKSVNYAFDVVAGSSPLHIACFMGRLDVVCCLLDNNANINITKEDGTTPLFYSCEVGHEDIVRLLLDKAAETKICRLDGKSPLKIAIDNKHTAIVEIVTEHIHKTEPLL
ncbi:uncharacterized protein LOC143052933 [Mytilus galloprovincialis]|uniref:uncharacterized protein LOC143052933 n=1 Tax=Mytilus galloprovincialis TaxID=29158 RepID=UPI003F7BD326